MALGKKWTPHASREVSDACRGDLFGFAAKVEAESLPADFEEMRRAFQEQLQGLALARRYVGGAKRQRSLFRDWLLLRLVGERSLGNDKLVAEFSHHEVAHRCGFRAPDEVRSALARLRAARLLGVKNLHDGEWGRPWVVCAWSRYGFPKVVKAIHKQKPKVRQRVRARYQ